MYWKDKELLSLLSAPFSCGLYQKDYLSFQEQGLSSCTSCAILSTTELQYLSMCPVVYYKSNYFINIMMKKVVRLQCFLFSFSQQNKNFNETKYTLTEFLPFPNHRLSKHYILLKISWLIRRTKLPYVFSYSIELQMV